MHNVVKRALFGAAVGALVMIVGPLMTPPATPSLMQMKPTEASLDAIEIVRPAVLSCYGVSCSSGAIVTSATALPITPGGSAIGAPSFGNRFTTSTGGGFSVRLQ
jgi:hypothetical protein